MATGYAGPPAGLELYERLVATIDAVDRRGATMPYTSRNGHMFSLAGWFARSHDWVCTLKPKPTKR